MEITVNDKVINVKDYLPFEDKTSIMEIAYQEATDNTGFFNYVKFNALKSLYVVLYYTDLEFTTEEKAEPLKLYDRLFSDGTIEAVINALPKTEFHLLDGYGGTYAEDRQKYEQSFQGTMNKIIGQIPSFVEGLTKSLNEDLLPKLQAQVEELKSGN